MDAAIFTENLTRRFGDLAAVQDVNLRVEAGQFYGFLGPNGAGKSTTIKMLTGLMAATSGRMQILGLDLSTHLVDVKRQIGVVPEGMALFGRLTGAEYLNFAGRMYGLDRNTAARRAAELLEFMVQVQSTLFPLYDRNPQTFVPNIFDARPGDYQKATQRIWHGKGAASFISLPVVAKP